MNTIIAAAIHLCPLTYTDGIPTGYFAIPLREIIAIYEQTKDSHADRDKLAVIVHSEGCDKPDGKVPGVKP